MPAHTDFRDQLYLFQGLSAANHAALSVTAGQTIGNYSITASFVPLRTWNPGQTDAATIARMLCTWLMDLTKPR